MGMISIESEYRIEEEKMIIGIALVVSVISIIGCIEIKKPEIRVILGMLALINILIVVLAGSFTYTTRYKTNDVAYSASQDGTYVVLFQQVGNPDWPFGHTHARLVLKDDSRTIAKRSFDVANDGANVHSGNCQITWKADCVEAVISGEEQSDTRYTLYFNGKTDFMQLDTPTGEWK